MESPLLNFEIKSFRSLLPDDELLQSVSEVEKLGGYELEEIHIKMRAEGHWYYGGKKH